MSVARLRAVAGLDFRWTLRRPMLWTMLAILILLAWGLSTGNVQISSGSTTVGGRRAWITSEFSLAFIVTITVATLYVFFASIAAGMSVIEDDEAGVNELLQATPLRPGEYIWGKALAVTGSFVLVLLVNVLLLAFFNHVVPNPDAAEIRGPFGPLNYLRPALLLGLPVMLFYIGVSFYLGERLRRPAVVFLFPLAGTLIAFFLWNWTPGWLDPSIDRLLMLLDPGGIRWLNGTWLDVDRGAEFYNTTPVGYDLAFVMSRIGFALLGLTAVIATQRHFRATSRQAEGRRGRRRARAKTSVRARAPSSGASLAVTSEVSSARAIHTVREDRSAWRRALVFAWSEVSAVAREPGFYLFAFFIITQTLGTTLLQLGPFQTRLILTSGILAAGQFNTLTLLVSLLVMFFLVEGLERERAVGLDGIAYSTPARTRALVVGKVVGASLVGLGILLAVFLGGWIAQLIQGQAGLHLRPYAVVWGLLLLPTFLAWSAFIAALQAVSGNRYITYGVGLGVVAYTLYRYFTGEMNWVGNWMLWDAVRWSDISVLELDRKAIFLNRLVVLGLAALCLVAAIRFFRRRALDATRTLQRLRPGPVLRGAAGFIPYAVLPVIAGLLLWLSVLEGPEGAARERRARDYWKQNYATWKDAPQPSIASVDLALDLYPDESRLSTRGRYRLLNPYSEPLDRFALTGGDHWRDVRWTLNGASYDPEDRSGLYVFELETPLGPGEAIEAGFRFSGRFPDGVSENGGSRMEFILPSGVVLTGFRPSFAPLVGFDENRGVDEENEMEPPDYRPDHYLDTLPPAYGSRRPFSTRIAVSAPADFTVNGVGRLVGETESGGRRTVIWESDEPVSIFNVVAGRWQVRRGEKTAIFFHPEHAYNVDEMLRVLDGARRWYSTWFYPYPWQELKLSEFPGLATYAQGFATNITFSESIGFLTEQDPETDAVALVTAHEAAHQWWGNLLRPGDGPGGVILSEGMAHFATALLLEELNGPRARQEFLKRIEEDYLENRRTDNERPLVRVDPSRVGDRVLVYDKGGWVAWMLMHEMGREPFLEGLRAFIERFRHGPDYPLLEDLIQTLRPFASDTASFDRFVEQWFFDVVLPEYRLDEPRLRETGDSGWTAHVRVTNVGSARVPVQIVAVRDDRSSGGDPGLDDESGRATVILGAGESRRVELRTVFRPERIEIDPDVHVLQLGRERARVGL